MMLTKAQQNVFDFICRFVSKNGFSPSREEIASGLGYKSHNAAQEMIVKLEKKGVVKRVKGKNRALKIV